MAEGVGFEPTRERKPPGGFQDRCLKPLGHPSSVMSNRRRRLISPIEAAYSRRSVEKTNREPRQREIIWTRFGSKCSLSRLTVGRRSAGRNQHGSIGFNLVLSAGLLVCRGGNHANHQPTDRRSRRHDHHHQRCRCWAVVRDVYAWLRKLQLLHVRAMPGGGVRPAGFLPAESVPRHEFRSRNLGLLRCPQALPGRPLDGCRCGVPLANNEPRTAAGLHRPAGSASPRPWQRISRRPMHRGRQE